MMYANINIYGPAASGKTRYAEQFRSFYKCRHIIDEGKTSGRINLVGEGPHLILTQQRFEHPNTLNIRIASALRAIGVDAQ